MKFSYNDICIDASKAHLKTSNLVFDEDSNTIIEVNSEDKEKYGEMALDEQGEPIVFLELYVESEGISDTFSDLVYGGSRTLYLEHPYMIVEGAFVLCGMARNKNKDGTRSTTYLFKSNNSNATVITGEDE